ncbi:MAG TPA: hypothetical protein VFD54_16450 [Anaerolineales bacterium]|jgi:hypothetical protein|nr:hypothetical protein [Anaerolineales bacterium]
MEYFFFNHLSAEFLELRILANDAGALALFALLIYLIHRLNVMDENSES